MMAIQAPQNYLNRDGLISEVGDFVGPLASRILIVTGPQAWQATSQAIESSLRQHNILYEVTFQQGPCTHQAIDQVATAARTWNAELILGVGGGRALDCAKAVGDLLGQLPVVAVPTIAATCAAWSPISVIYDGRGAHVAPLPLKRLPVWVLVDSEVIARSPARYLKAGIVDALAKWYEFQPYLQADPTSLALVLKARAAGLALEMFNRHGDQALKDIEAQRVTSALRQVIDANIALAGLANSMKDDVARVGVAHAIHNSMTRHPELHHWLHGEKVGFGLVVQALLNTEREEEQQPLLALLSRFGSPLTLTQLGLADKPEQVESIARHVRIRSAALLPFAVDNDAILKALWKTENLATVAA